MAARPPPPKPAPGWTLPRPPVIMTGMTISLCFPTAAQRCALAAVLCLGALQPACKKNVTTPPVATTPFVSPQDNQRQLVANVSVRGIEGSIATLSAMSKDLRLPFGAEDLRAMLMARTGLPESLVQHLDLSAPMGFAVVGRQKGTSPFTAAAMAAKSKKDAKAFVAALGTKLREEKGAVAVRSANGSEMWIYVDDTLLVGSDSLEGLRAAGGHAMASRRAPAEDIVARFFPEAYAQTEGTDLKTALRDLRMDIMAEVRRNAGASPLPPEALETLMGAAVDAFVDPLVDTQAIDVALAFDSTLGVRLLSHMLPKPQTALAKSFGVVKPYTVDGALLSAPLPAGLFAVTYGPDTIRRYQQALQKLAGINVPGVKAMVAGLQTLAASLTGSQSGRFGFDKGLEHTLIAPLNAGVTGETTMGAVENLLGPAGLGTLVRETHRQNAMATPLGTPAPPEPKMTWQRQGLKGRLDITAPATNSRRTDAAVFEMLGGDHLGYSVMVSGQRLLMTSSPRGDAHLAQFANATATSASDPQMQQVLKETAGREGFVYMDLFQLLRPALATAAKKEPSLAQANAMLAFIPGVDKLRVPLIASYVGGPQLTMELAVPYRTLKNVSALLGPLLGMGLGGALMGPQ